MVRKTVTSGRLEGSIMATDMITQPTTNSTARALSAAGPAPAATPWEK